MWIQAARELGEKEGVVMANENVKRSFHSIDHSGHIVPNGPLDERLRNIEGRLEGGRLGDRSSLPAAISADIDALRREIRSTRDRVYQVEKMAHASARSNDVDNAHLSDALARIAKIEQAMKLMCTSVHAAVPAHANGYDGTNAFTFMRPDVVKVHHVRLADDSPTCLRITSIRCGLRVVSGDGNINEIVYPGQGVTVTVANSGLGIVSASVLVFYEEGVGVCDSYAKGYEYGAKMAGR